MELRFFFFWLELLICYKLFIEGYCVKAIIVSRSELLLFTVSMWEQEGWRLQTAHLIQLLLSQLGTQRDDSAAAMLGMTPGKWGKMAFVMHGTKLISEIKLSFISLCYSKQRFSNVH